MPLAEWSIQERAVALQKLIAQQPAGHERIAARIGRDIHYVAAAAFETWRKCRAMLEPDCGIPLHAPRQRIGGIDIDPKQRPRPVEILVGYALQHVARAYAEPLDREVRCAIERNQGPALSDEQLQRFY